MTDATPESLRPSRNPMRRLYDWVLGLAASRFALAWLCALTFAESMIFPIPPDVLLVPMCVARPQRGLVYAAWMSGFSVLGGVCGYALGLWAWEALGPWFFEHLHGIGFTQQAFERIAALYAQYDFAVVFTAGFSPIPYKLFTISAGVFEISFAMFVVASAVSRSARFLIVAGLLKRYGPAARDFIERRFNLVAIAFALLLVGGFVLVANV